MSERFEVFLNYENFSQALAVYIFVNNPDGTRSLCTDLKTQTFKPHHPGIQISDPTFRVEGEWQNPSYREWQTSFTS